MVRLACLLASVCVIIGGYGLSPSMGAEGDNLTAEAGDAPDRVMMNAIRVPDSAITLDGRDDDWRRIPSAALARCRYEPGPEMWSLSDESRGKYFGREDCSIVLHFAHDTNYLYLLVEVRDQVLFNTAGPTNPNEGDDIELFIDANAPDQRFADANNENVRQIMIVAGNINPAWRRPFIWQSHAAARKPQAASRLTPRGYTMEIAIPKASFPYWKDHPELDAVGFDGMVVDADAPGVDAHHPALKGAIFYGTYFQHFLKPTNLALLTLEKEAVVLDEDARSTPAAPTAEQTVRVLVAAGAAVKPLIGSGGLPIVSPIPPAANSEALAQAVLDLIDDPAAGAVAAAAVTSRSHLVAKAGMLVLARRPNLPPPRSLMDDVKRLAGRKDPEAIAAVSYAMEAMAVRGKLPLAEMLALVKPVEDTSMMLTYMYYCGVNGDKAATPILLSLLKSESNFRTRMMAILAIGLLKDATALDVLQEATNDKNGDVRLQAQDAIKKIQAAGEKSAENAAALVGKWILEGEVDSDVFPPDFELSRDGTMKLLVKVDHPDGPPSLSWKADSARLTFTATHSKDKTMIATATCEYTLSGSTLTLSNGNVSGTVDGRTVSDHDEGSAAYKKAE